MILLRIRTIVMIFFKKITPIQEPKFTCCGQHPPVERDLGICLVQGSPSILPKGPHQISGTLLKTEKIFKYKVKIH